MQPIDIGINLTHVSLVPEREALLVRVRTVGVVQIVTTGTGPADSEQALQPCGGPDEGDRLFTTAGTHPYEASHWNADTARGLRVPFDDQRVRAVDECDLDFNRDFSPRPAQEKAPGGRPALIAELQRPVSFHEHDTSEHPLAILCDLHGHLLAAVAHCFTGECRAPYGYLDLDLHIGITGWIDDERRGTHLHDPVGEVPVGRLMLESNASYLLPYNLRPKLKNGCNKPAYLAEALACMVRHCGESAGRLVAHTSAVMRAFLGLPTIDWDRPQAPGGSVAKLTDGLADPRQRLPPARFSR